MDEHAEPVDGLRTRGPGRTQERRLERVVHDVGDGRARRRSEPGSSGQSSVPMPTEVALTTSPADSHVGRVADPGHRRQSGGTARRLRRSVDDGDVGRAGATECVDDRACGGSGAEHHDCCSPRPSTPRRLQPVDESGAVGARPEGRAVVAEHDRVDRVAAPARPDRPRRPLGAAASLCGIVTA